MSTKRVRLLHRIEDLVASSASLRASLQAYEQTMIEVADRVESGEPAVAATEGTSKSEHRRRVTEAITEFEAARHQLRLALFALGHEEGASISEVGRVLGISRQLAARLAGETEALNP
jgi:DNA-directed RNA polymerase sigma subunit (sigma70/sigma32)